MLLPAEVEDCGVLQAAFGELGVPHVHPDYASDVPRFWGKAVALVQRPSDVVGVLRVCPLGVRLVVVGAPQESARHRLTVHWRSGGVVWAFHKDWPVTA